VGNGKILREGPFESVWVQPAAGDAGGALGAALFTHYQLLNGPRRVDGRRDLQAASLLGPAFDDEAIEAFLQERGIKAQRYADPEVLVDRVAALMAEENVIGWFQGRMEFGPRALGGRSILGDPRSRAMQTTMNLKIKFRESFRPFAPSVALESVNDFFQLDSESPYMLLVAGVQEKRRLPVSANGNQGLDKLKVIRSEIPAITHVDYSARVQTVASQDNPLYHRLIQRFGEKTGCPVIVNTSFNVRGEPIVCTPEDAYRCFTRTNLDFLVLGPYVIDKAKQNLPPLDTSWQQEFELD
jgi:carbamoyltransferase